MCFGLSGTRRRKSACSGDPEVSATTPCCLLNFDAGGLHCNICAGPSELWRRKDLLMKAQLNITVLPPPTAPQVPLVTRNVRSNERKTQGSEYISHYIGLNRQKTSRANTQLAVRRRNENSLIIAQGMDRLNRSFNWETVSIPEQAKSQNSRESLEA